MIDHVVATAAAKAGGCKWRPDIKKWSLLATEALASIVRGRRADVKEGARRHGVSTSDCLGAVVYMSGPSGGHSVAIA